MIRRSSSDRYPSAVVGDHSSSPFAYQRSTSSPTVPGLAVISPSSTWATRRASSFSAWRRPPRTVREMYCLRPVSRSRPANTRSSQLCSPRLRIDPATGPALPRWMGNGHQMGNSPVSDPQDRCNCSALGRNRTCDTRFRKPMLYPLSYEGGRCGSGRKHRRLKCRATPVRADPRCGQPTARRSASTIAARYARMLGALALNCSAPWYMPATSWSSHATPAASSRRA